ncbi:hypothetical protein BV509_09750 [Rhodovulum sulfidophilum]|nr:hypothetical protein BV509_09750 [Rhodovulum sulfidophilum]
MAASNPKAIAFFTALFPHLLSPEGTGVGQLAGMVAVVCLSAFAVATVHGGLGAWLRRLELSHRAVTRIHKTTGGIFVASGIGLAASRPAGRGPAGRAPGSRRDAPASVAPAGHPGQGPVADLGIHPRQPLGLVAADRDRLAQIVALPVGQAFGRAAGGQALHRIGIAPGLVAGKGRHLAAGAADVIDHGGTHPGHQPPALGLGTQGRLKRGGGRRRLGGLGHGGSPHTQTGWYGSENRNNRGPGQRPGLRRNRAAVPDPQSRRQATRVPCTQAPRTTGTPSIRATRIRSARAPGAIRPRSLSPTASAGARVTVAMPRAMSSQRSPSITPAISKAEGT